MLTQPYEVMEEGAVDMAFPRPARLAKWTNLSIFFSLGLEIFGNTSFLKALLFLSWS